MGMALLFLQISIHTASVSAAFDTKVDSQQKVISPGVTYFQERYQSNDLKEVVNYLHIDLLNSYTSLEIGLPDPMNSLKTTTNIAKANNYEGHRVVGATNAAYFAGNGAPLNLLVNDNVIVNYGILGDTANSPTQQPVAFGVSQSGKAIADYYKTDVSFTVNGTKNTIDRINYERTANTTVLYTASEASTNTNNWGLEIVVTGASKNTESLSFGDVISGTVESVTPYGQTGNSAVPADGFVISIQNKELASQFENLEPGTPIQVNLAIDEKWMNAKFILAAGPLLVKDGKVNISMPQSEGFSKTRSDRTAVAIDATGKKVFLVTVDGRQAGYSNGANLPDLASYLISKGAHSAINLDGGGSTTLVMRNPGEEAPKLVNRPSGGSERRVSATLQVINSAPPGKLKAITISGVAKQMAIETTTNLNAALGYDEFLNPVTIQPENVKWSVEGGIGQIVGNTFKATKVGTGKIVAVYDGVRSEVAVQVTKAPEVVDVLDSFDNATAWTASAAKAKATIGNASKAEPFREGSSSLKLTYDFTTADTGTKAVYAAANKPIAIAGAPKQLGVWVYGDAGNHWLRANVIDSHGAKHTIDFTEQGGFNWTGWKYVTAAIPQDLSFPIQFDRIYVTEPNASNHNRGVVYFDKLQAVYAANYKELMYTDVKATHWASSTIELLNTKELVKGYPNGTFKPDSTITRAEAATIIARALGISKTKNHSFTDVKSNHFASDAIAAVSENGIITGREASKFSPDDKLTRAEMATILKRAYNLTGTKALPFKDVKSSHWAYEAIQTVYYNQLTGGYPDNTFRPNQNISRAEFATFLSKVLDK